MDDFKFDRQSLVQIVSSVILGAVGATALIGLALLFGLIGFSDILGQVLLSLLTIFIAGLFLLNSINAVTVGNKLGIIAAIMIIVSAVLYLALIWLGGYLGSSTVFAYFIVPISMLSVLLNLIVGHYIVLGKRLLAVQIILYVCFAYIELAVSFAIFGNADIISLWQVFVATIIVSLALYIVLKVKEKNIAQADAENKQTAGEDYITVSRKEYEELKAEVERLKTLVGEQNKEEN